PGRLRRRGRSALPRAPRRRPRACRGTIRGASSLAHRAPPTPVSRRRSGAALGSPALAPERRALDGGPERIGAVGTGASDGNRGDDPRGTPRPRARAAGELRRIGRDAHALLSV